MTDTFAAEDRPKYTAPALEKGLDIIEFMARSTEPKNVNEIALGLNRSRGELFRMISVLQRRGILEKTRDGDHFFITDKLFSLRRQQSFATQITTIAVSRMEAFSAATGQSCHLAVRSGGEIVVILKVEHPDNLNVSVPIGHRRSLVDSPSGQCILAFSDQPAIDAALGKVKPKLSKAAERSLRDHLDEIRKAGHSTIEDGFALGIRGISAPIIDQTTGGCSVALTTTLLQKVAETPIGLDEVVAHLRYAAAEISRENY